MKSLRFAKYKTTLLCMHNIFLAEKVAETINAYFG